MAAMIIIISFVIIKSVYCLIYASEHKISAIWLIFCVVALLSAIWLASDRNTYLPFLGRAVYPCGSLPRKTPENADAEVTVSVPANVNVIYWASELDGSAPRTVINNPWDAYKNFANSGVVMSDSNGTATLKFRKPVSYKVANGMKTLKTHVHYRYCMHPGMLSPIYTAFV
jgi:hypothetical protein